MQTLAAGKSSEQGRWIAAMLLAKSDLDSSLRLHSADHTHQRQHVAAPAQQPFFRASLGSEHVT